MRRFAVVGHRAATAGDFSLNDLPGSAGRMDILCRCAAASLFLSHGLRRDAECYLVLCGEPAPPKTVLFRGGEVRSLSPDERSVGGMIKSALAIPCGALFRESAPGIYVRRGGLERLLAEVSIAVLEEDGSDVRAAPSLPEGFLLSDHENFSPEECALIEGLPRFSLGPRSLHADHAIAVLQNELDRRECGWT